MRKWEYMVTRINGAIAALPNSSHSNKLAEYGNEGWELVSMCNEVDADNSITYAYFKRPIE
jgi:hypothetical protein